MIETIASYITILDFLSKVYKSVVPIKSEQLVKTTEAVASQLNLAPISEGTLEEALREAGGKKQGDTIAMDVKFCKKHLNKMICPYLERVGWYEKLPFGYMIEDMRKSIWKDIAKTNCLSIRGVRGIEASYLVGKERIALEMPRLQTSLSTLNLIPSIYLIFRKKIYLNKRRFVCANHKRRENFSVLNDAVIIFEDSWVTFSYCIDFQGFYGTGYKEKKIHLGSSQFESIIFAILHDSLIHRNLTNEKIQIHRRYLEGFVK